MEKMCLSVIWFEFLTSNYESKLGTIVIWAYRRTQNQGCLAKGYMWFHNKEEAKAHSRRHRIYVYVQLGYYNKFIMNCLCFSP